MKFTPQGALKSNTKAEIYALVKYEMFEELKTEFPRSNYPADAYPYPAEQKILLEPIDPTGNLEYEHDIELPYGRVTIKPQQGVKTKKDEEI